MSCIEAGLHEHHASLKDSANQTPRESQEEQASSSITAQTTGHGQLPGQVFATVNSVVSGSPADDAGLEPGDEIQRFGDVHWMNHEKLGRVATTVQRNEGVSCLYMAISYY